MLISFFTAPANGVVEYAEHHFRAALFNFTEYMGFPDDETDRRWQDLYNDYATSVISEEEAKNLITPTLRIPGTAKYLVQLDVFHELHCLNDMRKLLYPERFDGIQNLTAANGTVNRDTNMFRHWEHCVDSLRQTLMCHADVSPIPFHINRPMDSGIFPRLATTHTCRNFTKVQEWAREHSAGDFKYELELEEAREIAAESGFDNSPEEDIEFLYDQFPGDPFFKYWREHPLPTVGSSSTE
ncbi:hypothetical protein H2200_008929 [Cladophialophora chaetospira]|uniref:Tat pathway signal sequence n=1 Tax=Cladophialophora chaetospira TaxID=386627 RepID=A0AA38X506_9EURO|nr:hypothetical protein H2200_008929 [Cladophialophora chaetospira]